VKIWLWRKGGEARKCEARGRILSKKIGITKCITFCYILSHEDDSGAGAAGQIFAESAARGRAPHKKQDLIRLTLQRHLREVIEQEAVAKPAQRITNIEPWPRQVIEKAFRRMSGEWNDIEEAGTRAQGAPGFND